MIKNILIGNTNAIRAYFGNSLVWDSFDPVTLFAGGKQGVLYDPSKLSSLWQNAARTIPVTADGDPVGCMDDLSGNGNHASQSVSAARPAYQTANMHLDGVDDFLLSSSSLVGLGDFSIFLAVHIDSNITTQMDIVEASVSGGLRGARIIYFNGNYVFQIGNGSRVTIGSGVIGNRILTLIYNGTQMIARVDGAEVGRLTVTNYIAPASDANQIGREKPGFGYFKGLIKGLVITHRALTVAEINSTEQYLAAKAGVTL